MRKGFWCKAFLAALLIATAILLSGCNKGAESPANEDTVLSMQYGGIERTYLIHLPENYSPAKGYPLVLSLHGGGGNAESHRETSRLNETSDEKGFIVVYPNGTTGNPETNHRTWNSGDGCCGYAADNNIDDVGFINSLISELISNYKINEKMIYLSGYSNGARMTFRIACEAPEKISAIGTVAGDIPSSCPYPKKIPLIHFNGTEDTIRPYGGGECGNIPLLGGTPSECAPVEQIISDWASRNNCDTQTKQSYQKGNAECKSYEGCGNSDVELCKITGGGHTWPGGAYDPDTAIFRSMVGPLTKDISANEEMWKFFELHPMR